jgi:hypothetical protein
MKNFVVDLILSTNVKFSGGVKIYIYWLPTSSSFHFDVHKTTHVLSVDNIEKDFSDV